MKQKRHDMIVELIHTYDIDTQEELAARLYEKGFKVTQATVSRDIRELKLSKISTEQGRQRYTIPKFGAGKGGKYARILKDAYLSMELSGNILVIKTVSGMAMALAAALDEMHLDALAGSIAGDDTVFCVIRDKKSGSGLMERLHYLIAE